MRRSLCQDASQIESKVESMIRLSNANSLFGSYSQPCAWQVAVAPDSSPVFTRDIGTQEIYTLSVTWP
jgi:hypothetical protein